MKTHISFVGICITRHHRHGRRNSLKWDHVTEKVGSYLHLNWFSGVLMPRLIILYLGNFLYLAWRMVLSYHYVFIEVNWKLVVCIHLREAVLWHVFKTLSGRLRGWWTLSNMKWIFPASRTILLELGTNIVFGPDCFMKNGLVFISVVRGFPTPYTNFLIVYFFYYLFNFPYKAIYIYFYDLFDVIFL